jgi:hypothetical protein
MKTGGKVLLLSGCLVASGCAANHEVQVRAIADPNSKLHYSGGLLGEARAQLAMGAVGLAIESFRTLQRQQPDSVEAYAGLAACYAAMGRYDLTRTNYELALAYAPDDPALLQALASTLDKLGETEQAAQVRTEIRMAAAKPAPPELAPAPLTPLGVPRPTSMTVKVPEALPAPALAQSAEPTIAPPKLGPAQVDLSPARLSSMGKPTVAANANIVIPRDETPAAVLGLVQEPDARTTTSLLLPTAGVDVQVGRAAQVPQRAMQANVALAVTDGTERPEPVFAEAKVERPVTAAAIRKPQLEKDHTRIEHGPYLERTSLGEVALITIPRPTQQATLQSRAPQLPRLALIAAPPTDKPAPPTQPAPRTLLAATEVRWVPLRYAPRPQSIELLNAARTDGLAARTRIALVDRGWRKIRIGNARKVRQHSLVLYAAGHWHVAARLAAQLRCKAVRMASGKNVIVLLGRDAALRRGATSRA